MISRTVLFLAPLTVALSGCITASDLNDQLLKDPQASEGAVRVDTCPGTASPPGALMAAKVGVQATAPDLSDFSGRADGSAYPAAREVILAAANVGQPRAQTKAAALAVLLDMNLAQFAPQLDELDPEGARLANQVYDAPALKELMRKTDAASKAPSKAEGPPIEISRAEWSDTLTWATQTTNHNGWTTAFIAELDSYLSAERAGLADPDRAEKLAQLKKKYLIAAYMLAYFRNGEIFTLDFNQASLNASLKEKLKDTIKDDQLRKAVETELDSFIAAYEKDLCKTGKAAGSCTLLGKIGEETFVTRAGAKHGFNGFTFTLDVGKPDLLSTSKVDANVLAPDLIRVVIEAIGDNASQVPGVKTSTLCAARPNRCATAAENDAMKRVNDAGDRVESGTSAAVGAAIRGGWFFSLNNETLASTITTGVAVTARKFTEAATWKAASGACPAATGTGATYQTIKFRLLERSPGSAT